MRIQRADRNCAAALDEPLSELAANLFKTETADCTAQGALALQRCLFGLLHEEALPPAGSMHPVQQLPLRKSFLVRVL